MAEADEDHRFNSIRFQCRHVEKDISSHAQTDRPTLSDAKMVEQCDSVQSTLPVGDRFARIVGSTVTASVGLDESIFMRKLIIASIDPIFPATRTAMKKQKRFSCAFTLVIHLDIVDLDAFDLHERHYGRSR